MFDYSLLEALSAVIRYGSFERAAESLHVSASAVSQRIKLLEERSGAVLVLRGKPCTATPTGRLLSNHAESVQLLERGLHQKMQANTVDTPVKIALNADSLATWFMPVMQQCQGLLFDVHLNDQAETASWLRNGRVQAAVTDDSAPVQGCNCVPLGIMRYAATASPEYMSRWFPSGVDEAAITAAPIITFSSHDDLQTAWVKQQFGRAISPPTHWLPSTQAFVDGTLAGLGWALNPVCLVEKELAGGELVELMPERYIDVPLYWQRSRIAGDVLQPLTDAVIASAKLRLLPFDS